MKLPAFEIQPVGQSQKKKTHRHECDSSEDYSARQPGIFPSINYRQIFFSSLFDLFSCAVDMFVVEECDASPSVRIDLNCLYESRKRMVWVTFAPISILFVVYRCFQLHLHTMHRAIIVGFCSECLRCACIPGFLCSIPSVCYNGRIAVASNKP